MAWICHSNLRRPGQDLVRRAVQCPGLYQGKIPQLQTMSHHSAYFTYLWNVPQH
jgi:hypothetical protein